MRWSYCAKIWTSALSKWTNALSRCSKKQPSVLNTADDYYKYWVPGLDLSYQDMLLSGKLYVRLVIPTGAATAKLAGASGAIVLEFGMEPTQGI